MSNIAVEFKRVSKSFYTGSRYLPTIRELLGQLLNKKTPNKREKTVVLKDVNLTINKGQVIGFVGSNGAGKSTLLKLIARVTYPDRGEIRSYGRVSGILELGAGFHQELTAAENIFFSGMLLGLSRAEIENRFDQIVNFANLNDFINSPVKHFSSGMKARLGFSIAINVNPDILLVDEVLAVGDVDFQKKCIAKMKEFCADKSKTVVFVSHDLAVLENLCERLIYLDKGVIKDDGKPKKVIKTYMKKLNRT